MAEEIVESKIERDPNFLCSETQRTPFIHSFLLSPPPSALRPREFIMFLARPTRSLLPRCPLSPLSPLSSRALQFSGPHRLLQKTRSTTVVYIHGGGGEIGDSRRILRQNRVLMMTAKTTSMMMMMMMICMPAEDCVCRWVDVRGRCMDG